VATQALGDRELWFEEAVPPERARLYALAVTITRDPSECEDIVQDTLLAAWRSRPRLRDPARTSAWLTRICVNHCLQRARRRARWVSAGEKLLAAAPIRSRLDDRPMLDFDRAFTRLSPKQRAVFVLHAHHGYSVRECAEILGCRAGTARSHLGRVIAALRQEMSDDR
jgi:RNA polymerase sigma-70 factor (ECF subfamily)